MKLMPYLSKYQAKHGPGIPWDLIAPHVNQAWKNHGQSLEKIADRGGLSPAEALAIIEGRRQALVGNDESAKYLAMRFALPTPSQEGHP